MNNPLKGFSKIFSFTFRQHVKSRGYKNSTIVIALLCLLLPALVMTGVQKLSGGGEEGTGTDYPQQDQMTDISRVENIYAVDSAGDQEEYLAALPDFLRSGFGAEVTVTDYESDFDRAAADAAGTGDTLLIVISGEGDDRVMNLIIPENSGVSEEEAEGFGMALDSYAQALNSAAETENDASGEDPQESMEMVISMVLSFIILMVLYFFVLAYGQGVANSVVMEKNSKLMESFLLSVSPAAMILGKLLAITLTGLIQLFSWIGSLVISFAAGTALVRSADPDSDMLILQVFDMAADLAGGMFTPVNCIMAVLIVVAGMLLYCSLAAVGGAVASKAEDLSSANIIFTLVLVASFLAALYAGGIIDGDGSPVLDWIPFTAVMLAPSEVLMGDLPLWKTGSILLIIVLVTVAVTLIAGKIYKSLALYRGDVLSPKKLIKILRGQ